MRGRFTSSVWRRLTVGALVSGLVLRSAIPLGYMPGNLLAGELMVLCPTGMPKAVLVILSAHHVHDADVSVDADRDCPIGSALKPAWITDTGLGDVALDTAQTATSTDLLISAVTRPVRAYHQRAPPRV